MLNNISTILRVFVYAYEVYMYMIEYVWYIKGVFTPTLLLLIVQLKTSIVQTRNIYSFLVLYLYTHYYVLLCMYYDDLIKVNAPIKIIAL